MQKIGESTSTANDAGEFSEGNPAAGVDPTWLTAAWHNTIQRELISVVQGAGLTLDPDNDDQILQAIRIIAQSGAVNYGTDTGSAGAYAAAFTPAIATLDDKTVVRIKVKHTNPGGSTFSPDGLPAKLIVGGAHSPLQGGELAANGYAWLQYNDSIGAGSWVIVASSGGSIQVAAGTKSQHAMQLGQATGRLINVQVFRASGTYTPTVGTVSAIVEVQGGGGGGGAAAAASSGAFSMGCGGGGGGYAKGRITSPVVTSVVVGSGGAGGTSGVSQPGSAGGGSSFGTLITATGGSGGSGLPNGTGAPVQLNGAPAGLGAGGSITNVYGGVGRPAQAMNTANVLSGDGGASQLSPGGPQMAGNAAGQAGVLGSGGSGANVLGAFGPFAGGNGGIGAVIVWEYA